jgi:hypothetical protein
MLDLALNTNPLSIISTKEGSEERKDKLNTLTMSKIIIEAESKVGTLDESLENNDKNMADWIVTVLFGMMQDLQRLADEEPVPLEIDKRNLSGAMEAALGIIRQVQIGINELDYSLAKTNSFLLHDVFNDIHDLISVEKNENQILPEECSPN